MELRMLATNVHAPLADDPIKYYRLPIIGRLYRSRVARCVSMLPRGGDVLDVGYGSGPSFLNLAQKFDRIHGLEQHGHSADVARAYEHTGLDLHLRQGDVLDMPYDDNSFDAVLSVSVLEHLRPDEQATAFAELHRVLKPGGCCVVGVPGMNTMMAAAFRILGYRLRDMHFTSEQQVLESMSEIFNVDATHRRRVFALDACTLYLTIRGFK